MKFLFVIPSFNIGGAEKQALMLADSFACSGHEVVIAGFGPPGSVTSVCEAHGFEWHSVQCRILPGRFRNAIRTIKNLYRFGRFLRKIKPEVILPFCMLPNIACSLTWRFSGARLSIWNQRDEGLSRVPWLWEKLAVISCKIFVANSDQSAMFLFNELGVLVDQIHIIWNAVSPTQPKKTRDQWRRDLGVTGETFCACMIANLHAYKDHETLLYAWRIVQDRQNASGSFDPLMLFLAGQFGNTWEKLQGQVSEMGLGNCVRFLGYVEDIFGLLGAMDLGVFSSYREGLPNGVLECCVSGLPVVATDISGTRVALGKAGLEWLVAKKDAAALAERILTLNNDPVMRERIGQQNRARALEFFTIDRLKKEFEALIGRL